LPASISAVIVNYNAGALLDRCLRSLAADLDESGISWNAVVIDNGSTDGSADRIALADRLTVFHNGANRGFGAAVNQAARTGRGEMLWVLNPDCEVMPGAASALIETLRKHPDCAIAVPQLLNFDGSIQESARGEPTALTGLFGRHGLLTKFFPNAAPARQNLRARALVESGVDSAEIDWAMGASMLIRRDAFDRAGGFDERFFLYWEDADLCRRLRKMGYRTRYVPRARVRHDGAASSATATAMSIRAFHQSAYLYYSLHTVPSPLHPARWVAWIALRARAWWRTRIAAR
jgi:GT2 family glycosyltransferase